MKKIFIKQALLCSITLLVVGSVGYASNANKNSYNKKNLDPKNELSMFENGQDGLKTVNNPDGSKTVNNLDGSITVFDKNGEVEFESYPEKTINNNAKTVSNKVKKETNYEKTKEQVAQKIVKPNKSTPAPTSGASTTNKKEEKKETPKKIVKEEVEKLEESVGDNGVNDDFVVEEKNSVQFAEQSQDFDSPYYWTINKKIEKTRELTIVRVLVPGTSLDYNLTDAKIEETKNDFINRFNQITYGQMNVKVNVINQVLTSSYGCSSGSQFSLMSKEISEKIGFKLGPGKSLAMFVPRQRIVDGTKIRTCAAPGAALTYPNDSGYLYVSSMSSMTGTLLHEVGHNMGLKHSNYFKECSLNNNTIPSPISYNNSECKIKEYGNSYDVMGFSGNKSGFSPRQLELLDIYLPNKNMNNGGKVQLVPYARSGKSGLRYITFRTEHGYYDVSWRQAEGYESFLGGSSSENRKRLKGGYVVMKRTNNSSIAYNARVAKLFANANYINDADVAFQVGNTASFADENVKLVFGENGVVEVIYKDKNNITPTPTPTQSSSLTPTKPSEPKPTETTVTPSPTPTKPSVSPKPTVTTEPPVVTNKCFVSLANVKVACRSTAQSSSSSVINGDKSSYRSTAIRKSSNTIVGNKKALRNRVK